MKKLPLLLLASTLTTMTSARAETVILDDTFGSSTLNSATPANPDANSTAYQMLSQKSWSGESVGASLLRIAMVGTSSGYMECQALFSTNPITLDNEYDAIELRVTFTNTLGLLSAGSGQLNFGLYNSGGLNGSIKPVPGGLEGTLTSSQAGNASGNAQSWEGYFGQLFYDGGNNRISTREAQSGADNRNQSTANTGSGSASPANPAPVTVGSSVASSLTLTEGAVYTGVLRITKNGANSLAITNTLYAGPEPSGAVLGSSGGIATNSTFLTDGFDSITIAWRATGGSATTMDVSKLTVTKYTLEDLPALYNIQLNGHDANTYSGAGHIGSSGDVWNNPQWTGVDPGVSTNLFIGLTVLDSTGTDLGVSASFIALTNDNTGGWNTGPFNRYSGRTGGSATPGLMDMVVKSDWHGSPNTHTLTLTGLPANKLVTAYVYGAGDGSGQGSTWTFDVANGGDSAGIVYDGSATGRDVTLASSKGTSWEILSGTTDGSGNLTIVASQGNGATWWQTYLNGIQIQVGGTAPAIIGLADQTVEDGTTVVLSPVVTGNPPPTYQWLENGANMSGEINPSLTLVSVTTNQSGNVYSLVANNALGTVTNSMTLTVNASVFSTMTVTGVSPSDGATGICVDTPLTATFSDTISLGTIGSVKIFDASNPGTPVDTIDAADGLTQQRNFSGDGQSFTYPTFTIDGNTVTINPHFNVLTTNKTYYVTIDPKTFLDSGGTNFVGLTDTNAWRFTTKPTGPADPNNFVVNGNGSGDFLTVQGAVNSVPGGNTTPRIINVSDGVYTEIVNISGKHNITLRGQSRLGTLVGFANNATYQVANGGTTHARMSFKVNADDISIESLTLTNMTPQGGSQAEAFMLETGAGRCIVFDTDIVSRQDTILVNTYTSQAYFRQSTIRGNFDYIWGGGNVYFDECNIHTITGVGSPNITAARTTTSGSMSGNFPWDNPGGGYTANGLSFVRCSFTADGGGNITLAGNNGTAGNLVSWALCEFQSNHVTPSAGLFGGNYLFWQHGNTDLSSSPISFAALTTLTNSDPRLLAATNVATWLYGWTPQLLPNITSQPASQAVNLGDPAVFTVSANGIPAPNYQWKHSGTNLVGKTNATLNIASAQTSDAGDYVVEVSNSAGTVTSVTATLTTNTPAPPTISDPVVLGNGDFQFSYSGSTGQDYRIWATTNIALTPVTSTWDQLSSGVFTGGAELFTDLDATNHPLRFYLITVP